MTASTITDLSATDGYVRIQWTSEEQDPNWVAYRIYARDTEVGTWELLHEVTDVQEDYDYHHWGFFVGVEQDITVVEVTREGAHAPEEGTYDDYDTVTPVGDSNYWVIDPYDESNNFILYHVVSDDFEDEIEQEVIPLIGRGRKIDRGDNLGARIALGVQIRDNDDKTAREQRLDINRMAESAQHYILRTPFGDTWKVALAEPPKWKRLAGVGTAGYVDAELEFVEVLVQGAS